LKTEEGIMRIDRRQLLEALGIEREAQPEWPTALIGFSIGCLVGATVALLFSPKPGAHLRADLVDKGRDLFRRTHGMSEAPNDIIPPSTY
jgi:pimeloyl-ACP methyl ester carboxylesterase